MKRDPEETPKILAEQKVCNESRDVNDTWFQLYRSSLQSLARGDYDVAIDSSLEILSSLDTFKMMVLDTCAAAYAMKSNFDKAMEAAEKMIELTPTKAAGYLRAGNTLVLQGKHSQTIRISEQGMKKVPVDDEKYRFLMGRKTLSQAQLSKRVDFLVSLPTNISHKIIDRLDVADRNLGFMHVSKKWRQILVDYSLAWREVSVRSSSDTAIFRFLPKVGKHIHTLGGMGLSKEKSQQVSKAILSGQLDNLQYLHIHKCDLDPHELLPVLSRLGNTLTDLMLSVHKSSQRCPVEGMLLACPKLERFRYYISEGEMVFSETDVPVATMTNINMLVLSANLIKPEVLVAIVRRCPQLQELYVKTCPGDVLKSIHEHCPNLKSTCFNSTTPDVPLSSGDNIPGLHRISIHDTPNMDPENFIQLLKKSQPTLQVLAFSIYDTGTKSLERWSGLKEIKLDKLQHVSYRCGSSMDTHTIVAAMLRNCKAIQSTTFWNLNNLSGTVFEDALLTLPSLSTLNLIGFKEVNVIGLHHFLSTHAGKGKASSLRKMSFNQCSSFSDSLLKTSATIETVEEFAIYGCKGPTTDGLVKFAKQLCITNTLQSLHISDMDAVTDIVLHTIRNIHSLRYLGLVRLSDITVDAVQDLANSMKNLKQLYVTSCSQISMHAYYHILDKMNAKNGTSTIRNI